MIGDAMEAAGLSERALADESGIARSTLKRRLRLGDFTFAEIAAIGAALGTTTSDLARRCEELTAARREPA
ncbi:hypothetical protein GCM10012283_07010 [Phycicoccus endophyticus]|nr:hypothetical protein GCM10012283_07010 [Phycicoccus endophyticus]